jgi:hypothetical protein
MRKLLISTAAAASALAFAAPAAAQYWPAPAPQPYGYGYQAPYGGGYGYQHAYGQVRSLQVRIDRLQGHLDRLAQRRLISRKEYRRLHDDTHRLESRLRQAARYGLHPQESYSIEVRLARLERRVARDVHDGRRDRRGDYHGGGSYGGYGTDRDRDGRDDRYEDDRGYYPG